MAMPKMPSLNASTLAVSLSIVCAIVQAGYESYVAGTVGTAMQSGTADLVVVGGGAAGLAAAIFAAQTAPSGVRIVVLDGARTLGAKILIAGGGRCNVTHHQVLPKDFNGSRNIVRNILAAFDVAATVRWFASLGVELKREETGKLFPVANSAQVVLRALLDRCEALGINILTSHRVTRIIPPSDADSSFEILHVGGQLPCRRVIIST